MSCTKYGFTIPGDVNDRLAASVNAVAGADYTKAQVLVGYLGSEDFARYVEADQETRDYLSINANTLRRLLGSFFVSRHRDITNTINKKNADTLNGFTSAKAKTIAKDHTANLIIESYYEELNKPKTDRRAKDAILRDISKGINNNFNSKVVIPLIKRLQVENTNKEALGIIEKASAINAEIKALNKQRTDIVRQYNESDDIAEKTILNTTIDALGSTLNIKDSERYVVFKNLVDRFGNVREKNYSSLTSQVRGNSIEWFNNVFTTSKLINLVDDFSVTLENDKLIERNYADETGIVNLDSDSVDEMAKSWEDTLYGSFDRHVGTKLKVYLNRLYRLSSPTPKGSSEYQFDDNNELGVPMTIGANFVIAQVSNYATFNSVDDFINSVSKVSQINPNLYGLSKMVNDMIADREFANYIFQQLANPKIAKTIVTIADNGISFDHSNRSADVLSHLVFNMINSIKATYKNSFSTNDRETIKSILLSLNNVKDNNVFFNGETIKGINTFIENTLTKYFPKIDRKSIYDYLGSNPSDAVNIYKGVLQDISGLMSSVEDVVDDYNSKWGNYLTQYGSWASKKRIADDAGEIYGTPMPVFDYSSVNYSKLDAPIINLSKKLINYTAVKNELNSVNAEGNLASDLIGNNYITNFIKQIQFGSPEDINKGLNNLKDFILKSPQYKYSPFYFGVKDSNGNTISQGLFNRDSSGKVSVNPNAKDMINISLFDGAKDRSNAKSTMYSGMSKGDYFLTQLVAFNTPIKYVTNTGNVGPTAGYFMRTPSDAPKNFIVQTTKYSIDGLWQVVNESRTKYINEVQRELAAKHTFTSEGELIGETDDFITNTSSKAKNNIITAEEMYSLLSDEIDNKNYNSLYNVYDNSTNKVLIPMRYQKGETNLIVWLEGDKVVGSINNIAENIKVREVYNPIENEILPADLLIDIADQLTNDGVNSNRIDRVIDKNNVAFRAIQSHLLGEVNNYVNNLNNVFEKNNGKWTTKDNTLNLIDRAHYNGGEIVKDGVLTGNLFKFIRLFETNGYNPNSEVIQALSLYRQGNANSTDNLFTVNRNGKLTINANRTDIINTKSGRIEFSISNENVEKLNTIVENWLNNYYNEVITRTEQYNTILEDRYSTNDIVDYAINNAIMEMNFDDVFEGDTKFYKSAQDFLKRAKEVQAAGKAYAGFDINLPIGGVVKDVLDANGIASPIMIGDINIGNARNGFKAVTIENTVRPAQNAGEIKQELIDILTPQVGKTEATRIATEISAGYFDSTKVNDAQSYITLEEFARRRYADGTLNEYQSLLSQLMDDKINIEDIDLKGVNVRVQVQKNFYFDKQFDENTGTYYPRQIKNAEFVLIPKLIKGTDLEKLYDVMKANGIDQVNTSETSKAAKKNILTFWDNNGVSNVDAFNQAVKANNGIAIEDYYYQYLYKQQDVADHMVDEKNKAGIQVMKKIIDNANAEVQGDINNFFNNYVANIKDDFNMLLTRMGWKVGENGELQDVSGKLDGNGRPLLQFNDFYKKARVEAQRLGMDSNFMEYLTPDEFGQPTMPNYMNNVSSKLESIAQSIFNNGVTRQTLPGWHAAQVTGVGHGTKVLGEDGVFRELKYHPKVTDGNDNTVQESYTEIMIPRWSKLIPKDYDINKLATEGLDIHLGYRIPTEGKQSISNMKVVGFLDEIYGSTVMLADPWVTQTGSDFDVDSVYAISFEMYKDKDGTIKKIKLDTTNEEKDIQRRYVNYVNSTIEEKVDRDQLDDEFVNNEINKVRNDLKDLNKRRRDSTTFNQIIAEEKAIYNQLPVEIQEQIKTVNRAFANGDIVEKYNYIANAFYNLADQQETPEAKDLLEQFANYNETLANIINLSRETRESEPQQIKSAVSEKLKEIYEKNRLDYLDKVEKAAKKVGIVSYAEFAKWSIIEQNNRKARNNDILNSMINIMNNTNSREENYSRSNFDDLTNAMKKMNNLRGASALARSTYNPLDQIDFMENAMSGATLKAFSVTRDTFNSVNNYIKSTLSGEHTIFVEYDLNQYDLKQIQNAYDGVQVDQKNNFAIVNHNRLANSKNNRNVVGKILTVYSSQTTAHILDAVKEGTIFNENDYTFGTFKTLVDLGIDYDTAVGFLMQPGVTRIVDAYFQTKSIYINSSSIPVNTAIKSIATELGITIGGRAIDAYTPIKLVIQQISGNRNMQMAFRELFNTNISYANTFDGLKVNLNGRMLQNRLKQAEITNNSELRTDTKRYRDYAFDLAMIVNFDKYRRTARNIESIARVSNPDRFGAKQTIRSTRNTLNNIIKYSNDPNDIVGNTIMVGDSNIIQRLYPGIGTNQGIDIETSGYPYLAAFLKYATMPSVEANSQLFPTESLSYTNVTDTVQRRLGVNFTDEQYKEYKQYMMSSVYSGVQFLTSPLTLNDYGLVTLDNKTIQDQMESDELYWDSERGRIFGYDTTQSSSLEIADINNPTIEDIYNFNQLTPAQKVMWIQRNFNENRGVFDFLDVNTFNQYEFKNKGFTSQTIKYSDQIDDVEEIFVSFRDSFFNKNPLVRLASIDLIKYAFVVEGFKFKKGSISKIITNDAMYSNLEDKGMNIIEAVQQQFAVYNNPFEQATLKAIDKFVRSHSEIVKEVSIPKGKKDKQGNDNIGLKLTKQLSGDNVIYIPFQESTKELLEHISIKEDSPLDYIRLTKYISDNRKRTTLYKIKNDGRGVYLLPLNLLERNETSDYSANPKNNIYRAFEYYDTISNMASEANTTINELLKQPDTMAEIDILQNQFTIDKHQTKHVIETLENRDEINRILQYGSNVEKAETAKFVKDINDYFALPVEEQQSYGVVRNDNRFINSLVPTATFIIQNIPNGEEIITIKISKYTKNNGLSKQFRYVLSDDKRGDITKVKPEELSALQNSIDAKSVRPTLYKIERVTSEQERQDYEQLKAEIEKENADRMDAVTNLIEDFDVDVAYNFTDIDKVAKDIFNELNKRALSNDDKRASKFKKGMDVAGIDRMSADSIHNNKKNIYTSAAKYYSEKSHELLSNINTFTGINGEQYSIDNPALYKHLTEHPEDYPLLVKLILDSKTFGEQFYDIFNLNLAGEDDTTVRAITKIKDSINNVRTSSKLKNAVNLLFNDYIANNFSTNPLIRHGLIELKTQFGDTDWFDLTFSDVGELNHKQVQTVTKYVYSIINEANKLIAPAAVKKFNQQYEAIEKSTGSYDINNIIDSTGKFITPYTEQFLADREKVASDVKVAKENYGVDSLEYIKAKLARDKWRAKNVHQDIVSTYYNSNNNLVENILNTAPKEYLEYMTLIHERYGDNRPVYLLTKDEKDARRLINAKIRNLTSDIDQSGELKTDEQRYRAGRLKHYIQAKKALNTEYFNYDETDGFKDTLEYYQTIIKQYEKKHPLETLDQKLNNPSFREAYEWMQGNTIYTLDESTQKIISDAFAAIKSKDNPGSKDISRILKDADAYDEFGNIDPRKLSADQIASIKKLTEHKFSWTYDSNAGEAILIKDVPSDLPVLSDKFYRMLRSSSENDSGVNVERIAVIGKINALLGRAIDRNTGHISSKDLFEKLTEDELSDLASYYRRLHNIKGDRNNVELAKKFKANVNFEVNDAAFNREWAYAQSNLKGTKQYDTWLSIFIQTDKQGVYVTDNDGKLVANNDIFGYIVPKDKTYIDEAKTAARQVIENDIEYVPNEYYYAAMREVSNNGTFNEWYNANHIFNPYSHRMEPLKVWTTMQVNPNGKLKGTYSYAPTYENTERTVKDQYINANHKQYSTNYNVEDGSYNNRSKLSDKERNMLDLLQGTINAYASTHSMRMFAEQGYLPRRAKYTPDTKWYIGQAFGAVGLEFRNTGEQQWTDSIDYTKDFDTDFNMMSLIKQKGYKERLKVDSKGTRESDAEYAARVEDIRNQNKVIDADNLKLDNEILDRDWKNVFNDFIGKATEYNAKQRAKNTVYLLLEDLKESPAFKESAFGRNLKRDNKASTNERDEFQTVKQTNTHSIVENWARRILFDQFKKDSPYRIYADLAQNITSAKYMIANVTGGIANVATGMTNVFGEVFANDYFGKDSFVKGQSQYFTNSLSFIADMYKETTNNQSVAIAKLFDIVDFDAFTERRPNEKASENVKRVRDSLYSMQSGGEHYMQNSVLFALLKSHRIFKDTDGQMRVGSIANYNWELEVQTLMGLLNGKEDLLIRYKSFLKDIKSDLNELRKYDSFTKDFNEQFLRDVGDKTLINEYIAARKEALSKSEEEFAKNPTAEEQFELVDGHAVIKGDSLMTGQMFGELRQKVISINKKIHGVYDKIGAATIEKEWWGGLVMQYHKHIYPGIMKRYRTKGYYNELRNSMEKGSYVSLANYLAVEFRGLKGRVNSRVETDNENIALASFQEVIKSAIDTVLNLKLNYNLMPVWEQNNLKRALGDLMGIGSAFLLAIGIHLMTDDDEIKESELLSTALYMADRLNSESAMYTPMGLFAEAGTLWSSPIAAQNGPKDLIKGLGIATGMLFDSEYNPNYTTGLYKGQNKLAVLLYRNTPIYRVYQRLSNMTKNNNYYKINENALNIKFAKGIADYVDSE